MKHENKLLILAFLIIFFLFFKADWLGGDPTYETNIRELKLDTIFLPVFVFYGVTSYLILGNLAFFYPPIIIFFLSLYFIIKLFDKFKLNKAFILIGFLISLKFAETLWVFGRDNIFFLLATIYAYYFFKTYYNKRNYKRLILLAILLCLTKVVGVVFLIFIPLMYLVKNKGFFLSFAIWMQNYDSNYGIFLDNVEKFVTMIATIFPNPLFWVSASYLIRRLDKLHLLMVILTGLICIYSQMIGHPPATTFRYTLPLIPFHLFFLANTYKLEERLLFKIFFVLILIIPVIYAFIVLFLLAYAF